MIEVLTALLIAVTHNPNAHLDCTVPERLQQQSPRAIGFGGGDNAFLRPEVCRSAIRGQHFGLMVLAHESLHMTHPNASHAWIYRWDDWYAEHVVRWKLERVLADPTIPQATL